MKYRAITGKLVARTALHVGSGEGNELADSLLRRDTEGNILIPGTALAGALRSMLTRLAPRLGGDICVELLPPEVRDERDAQGCDCAVCRLFGDVEPGDQAPEGGEEGVSAASRLLVFNALLIDDGRPQTLVRDGVGIDRTTGAAARATGAKFAIETLSANAVFELRIEVREPRSATAEEIEEDLQLVAIALSDWQEGRARLGGDVARGLGAFELRDVRYAEYDLDDEDGLMSFLREPEPWGNVTEGDAWLDDHLQDATAGILGLEDVYEQAREERGLSTTQANRLPITTGWAEWSLTLQAEGPFLTNDATSAAMSGFDHAPLLEQAGDWTNPVLPGSSLRGVIRSHAERIARTLVTNRALAQEGAEGYFLSHCPTCDPLRVGNGDAELESCDSLLRHQKHVSENEEVGVDQLCLACRLFGSTRRGSRLIVEDAPYCGDELPTYKMLDFLAIDRFTGGGAEGLKFDALALWRPSFRARIFLDNPQEWELGWLTLALRDLAEGWLRVGFGAAKGFGKVTVSEGALRLASLKASQPTSGIFAVDELSFGDPALVEKQQRWVEAFNEQVSWQRPEGMRLPADTYFGRVDEVYGGEGR
jgi:CRISPR/Cas system CSM-associated protein Csm3 (group 7 of RAMP superfamily)